MGKRIDMLNNAKKVKNDEFYTKMYIIEEELKYYKNFFSGKTIFCNCDNPKYSNFYTYFYENFDNFKLKGLKCSFFSLEEKPFLLEINANKQEKKTYFKYNGDFRNEENIEALKQCDIVVTNPPFSLFREFVKLMYEYGKDFIILGSINGLKYKDVFPYIKDNKLFLGKSIHFGDREFIVPKHIFDKNTAKTYKIDNDGNYIVKVVVRWYTNIEIYENEPLKLTCIYDKNKYLFYDNYPNILNCDKVKNIPCDYKGIIGVPISFLDKYNKKQFDIIGVINDGKIGEKRIYTRILVKIR